MKFNLRSVETLLSGAGVRLPVEFIARLDIEEYLDQLDNAETLKAGEREHYGELLHAAEHITSKPADLAFSKQRQDSCEKGEFPAGDDILTLRENDMVLDFQRRHIDVAPVAGKLALGNILVANGQITRPQLEDTLRRQLGTGRRLGEELITAGHASKGQIESGLLLQRKLIAYVLAVTMGLAPLVPPAEASQKSLAMPVSVTVIANAKMQTNYQAAQLEITDADVARGYVEVSSASRFSVSTNSRSGYIMEFHPVGNIFESVQVGGLGHVVQLGADGGAIVQRGLLPPNLTHELSFRFNLRSDTLPGSHPWPLLLSVRALY